MIQITEQQLHQIIKETLEHVCNRVIAEYGIKVDTQNKTVEFDPKTENYVDTNSVDSPELFKSTIHGFEVLSSFRRKKTSDRLDGNPLIRAFKHLDSWSFKNGETDEMEFYKRFVGTLSLLGDSYETIIKLPSRNTFNDKLFDTIVSHVPHKHEYKDFFIKLSSDDVLKAYKDSVVEVDKMINVCFDRMKKENDGIFSYKFIPTSIRGEIHHTMIQAPSSTPMSQIAQTITGKNILLIDDTVSSGSTILEAANYLMDMYNPSNITIFTLMSPLTEE